MKSDSTTVIKNMEFLVKELHKEWDRSGVTKAWNMGTHPSFRENRSVCLQAIAKSHFWL